MRGRITLSLRTEFPDILVVVPGILFDLEVECSLLSSVALILG